MQKLKRALYLAMLLTLGLTGTCASPPESMVILVNVNGLTAEAVALSVELTFNGTKKQLADIKSNLRQFAITLPNRDDQQGQLQIAVTATTSGLCKVGSGSTTLSTDAGPLYTVDVNLAALSTPQCTLVIDVTGTGTVNAVAGNVTKMCTDHCAFDFPFGTNVTLNVETTAVNLPQQWSGDCGESATKPCQLVMLKRYTAAANFSRLCFGAGNNYATGVAPYSLAVGDFNDDKKLDLVAANGGSNNVSVLLGNGTGGFPASGSLFAVGASPYSVVVGNFDADTTLDLAIANRGNDNVSVLLGNGAGGFTAAGGSPFLVGTAPSFVAVGNFNADTKPDLAVVNTNSNNVSVLLGNGTGGFTAAGGSPFLVGTAPSAPSSAAVGDFNGDKILDLAVTNQNNGGNVSVMRGNGLGGFTAFGTSLTPEASPSSVAVGDFNGDKILDLAVANQSSNSVSVLLGNGLGGFTAAGGSPLTAVTFPSSVAVGDFNGDAKLDLAVANYNGSNSSVSVLLGNGLGGFTASTKSPFAVGVAPYSVVVGDFNGDAKPDLAVANSGDNNVSILLNQSTAGAACQ